MLFFDRVRVTTATTGTGSPLTLGAAVLGFRSFADAAVPDGAIVPYTIEDDGGGFEVAYGVYTVTGTTLTRVVSSSSNAGNPINLSGNAQVFIVPTAASMVGRQTIGVPMAAAVARDTNGPTALREQTADDNMIVGWRFAQNVDQHVSLLVPMPLSWDLGNLTARFHGRAPVATSGNVLFCIKGVALKDDTPSSIIFGGAESTSTTAVKASAGNRFISPETTPAVAASNTPAHPCLLEVEIHRHGSSASDTVDGDVDLMGGWLYYGNTRMTDTP